MFVRSYTSDIFFRRLSLSASVVALSIGFAALGGGPVLADGAAPSATETAVTNLLQGLVDDGVLPKKKAKVLMEKFRTDLHKAPATPAEQTEAAPEAAPGRVRVPYVPEIVKDQIRDEVKSEVMAQAKAENWAAPNTFPEWTSRIKLFGDVRVRDEGQYFGSDNAADFVDTQAMNAGSAYDINPASSGYKGLPFLNSTQDGNYVRLRARLGVIATLDEDWLAALRIGTGSSNSPTSTNQTLGSDFGKNDIWLDQAYIRYAPDTGFGKAELDLGRMPNPFEKTELVWDDDVNPDGFAASLDHRFAGTGWSLKTTLAAFTLDGVSGNANALSTNKPGGSTNRWLFAGQLGLDYQTDRFKFGFDPAFYDYSDVQSELSAPCSNLVAAQQGCPTDYTRPTFMQKGNTLFLLRTITDPSGTLADPQYLGLASKFEVLDLIAKADYRATDDMHVMFTGDFAKNLGYDASAIASLPIINNNETGSFKSGDTAWLARIAVGAPVVKERWDWNASFTYEYIEPDALLDAFTDSDFHLGGTNAKGFVVGGNLGVAHNTWLTGKWYSTDAVYGPPFAIDLLQLDLTTKF